MSSQSPIEKYESSLSSSEFLFLVYFRGHWCPFCMAYLTTLHGLEAPVSFAMGSIVVVTSEPEEHLAATRASTGFQGTAIVDEENVLAGYLKQKDLLNVAISDKGGYKHGMAQPGVLVIKKDGTVLEKWAIVPSVKNLGGAKDRPDLNQIWENVQAKLKGQKVVHKKYATQGAFGVFKGKLFG